VNAAASHVGAEASIVGSYCPLATTPEQVAQLQGDKDEHGGQGEDSDGRDAGVAQRRDGGDEGGREGGAGDEM